MSRRSPTQAPPLRGGEVTLVNGLLHRSFFRFFPSLHWLPWKEKPTLSNLGSYPTARPSTLITYIHDSSLRATPYNPHPSPTHLSFKSRPVDSIPFTVISNQQPTLLYSTTIRPHLTHSNTAHTPPPLTHSNTAHTPLPTHSNTAHTPSSKQFF